jgi:hypothetical protein
MTFDRSKTRTSRQAKFDVECLGERIVPAHAGFVSAAGHVHLNLVERLGSEKAFKLHHHRMPVFVTAPVNFNALKAAKDSPVAGKLAKNNPFITANPVSITQISASTGSPVAAKLPLNNPTITSNPITTTALSKPMLPAPKIMPANLSVSLVTIFNQYEKNPGGFTGVTSSTDGTNLVIVNGDRVGITVHDGNPSEFQGLMTELKEAGMTNEVWSAFSGTVVGMLPIAELVTIANYSRNVSVDPELPAHL